jgi:hypothetical protein
MIGNADETTPRPWVDVLLAIPIAALVTVIAAALSAFVVHSIDFGFLVPETLDRVVGIYPLRAWLVGVGVALACSLVSRRALGLGLAGVASLHLLALVAMTLFPHALRVPESALPVGSVIVLGVAIVAGVYLARRPGATPLPRGIALAGTLIAAHAVGVPTLIETHAEYRTQALHPFTLELAAAYPAPDLSQVGPGELPAVIVDRRGDPGEPIESRGRKMFAHHSDHLVIPSARTQRVRWYDLGDGTAVISIRVDGELAAALRTRSSRRISMLDAVFLDGELVEVFRYSGFLSDRLWLQSDPVALRRLYDRLVVR